jgi:hypothetical protein
VQSLRCLTWTDRGLFSCAQESLDQWTLALSTDDGQSFAPLWHVQDLVPLECTPGSAVEAACPRTWLDIASRIGADLVPGEPEPAAPLTGSNDSGCGLGAAGRSLMGLPVLLLAAVLLFRRRTAAR